MALHNGLIVCGRPYQISHVFCRRIIISMDIDDDIMDVILNNKQQFLCLWTASGKYVGVVMGLSGME
jgi:hypothetical protein